MTQQSKHTPKSLTASIGSRGAHIFYENDANHPLGFGVIYGDLDPELNARGVALVRLIAAAPDLLAALEGLNHMGGDERGGYCICPKHDGSAPDEEHATDCANARAAIAKAQA